ncbi:hypothetical protein [Nocardia sp. NBC_01388]|uniref:hypothetical protein n=1 Tax=Nocardia sp. NBC_01388 TaxID=2903596 RepID=UPI003252C22C
MRCDIAEQEGLLRQIGAHGDSLSAASVSCSRWRVRHWWNPDILILDKATASLDLATDARVRASVDLLTAGRTTIVVAHRLATAADADMIVVVGEGRLLQTGRHADLLTTEGPYRRLWGGVRRRRGRGQSRRAVMAAPGVVLRELFSRFR